MINLQGISPARYMFWIPAAAGNRNDSPDRVDCLRAAAGWEHSPDLAIKESVPVAIADGTMLRTRSYFPKANAKGNWEAVAYGEDGDYYVMFVVSSRSLQGYNASRPAFEKIVASYMREPRSAPQGDSSPPAPGPAQRER